MPQSLSRIIKGDSLITCIPTPGTSARKPRVKTVIIELEVSTSARKLRARTALMKLVLEEPEIKIGPKTEKLKKEIDE
jgi:hypothetical protein